MTQFYLRDSRSNTGSNSMFWSKNGGYTTNLDDAAQFSLSDAQRYHEHRCTDVPLSISLVDQESRLTVDCQYLPNEALKHVSRCVIQVTGQWDGNDIYFVCKDGEIATDYQKAEVFSYRKAVLFCEKYGYDERKIFPKKAIDKIKRHSFAFSKINKKTMITGAGIVIVQPLKVPIARYHCQSCGRFVTETVYYSYCYHGEPCPNCADI